MIRIRNFNYNNKGFTLIELLITISILAILMTIAMISYSGIQKGARDAKRKTDISKIQAALELYHTDQGFYPTCIIDSRCGQLDRIDLELTSSTNNTNLPLPLPVKTYLKPIPLDPININSAFTPPNYFYFYRRLPDGCDNVNNQCNNYCIYDSMENSNNANSVTACNSNNSFILTFNYSVAGP